MRQRRRPEWRILRGWSDAELELRLEAAATLPRNYPEKAQEEMTRDRGWLSHASEALLGQEQPGVPVQDGLFARACTALQAYAFSDPAVVEGHFRREDPLEGRIMLLELKPLVLRYLCAVRVEEVRLDAREEGTVFGYRYDTLEGHLERGFEWFLLSKDHRTGAVRFRIEARWRRGDFPNWWSRVGFELLGRYYQRRWHREAHLRLRHLVGIPGPLCRGEGILHQGPDLADLEVV